jgi:hypothetical protein
MASAKDHGLRLQRACSAVAQFEVSRQGLVWAPGERKGRDLIGDTLHFNLLLCVHC